MVNISDKFAEEIKIHVIFQQLFVPKILLDEIMCKNMEES
jgi:hypothetical protein